VTTLFGILAALAVLLHIGFVAFAALGGILVARWRWLSWLHVPTACWAAYVELSGSICPLTPLENALRARAGYDLYSGDFVARYIFPVLYPEGLTRDAQVVMGLTVAAVNVVVYGWVFLARKRRMRRNL
jgi:hypothetical protein